MQTDAVIVGAGEAGRLKNFFKIINEYFPNEPWQFKTGDRAGKYVEMLMFQEPTRVFRLKEYLENKSNLMQREKELLVHLSWVLAKSYLRMPKIKCSFCGEQTAKKTIFVRGDDGKYFSHEALVCCEAPVCSQKLSNTGLLNYALRKREEVQLKFPEIAERALDLERISDFLCKVFGISELTPETAFEFFNK